MSETETMLELELPADVRAPAAARRRLEDIAPRLGSGVFDDVRLLVNELITNSVRHVRRGEIKLNLRSSARRVRVEVYDCGEGFSTQLQPPAPTETSGRGLFLVQNLADRWGVSMDGETCVWFEIDAVGLEPAERGR